MPHQYKAFWAIPNAGPSVSTFHAAAGLAGDAQQFADRVRSFLGAIVARLPNEVSISFDTEVGFFDTQTGQLTGATPVTAPAVVQGTNAATWAAGTGARVVWSTPDIRNGRRVRGSTFLVPLSSDSFDANGRVSTTTLTTLGTAAQAFIAGMVADGNALQVWSRPIPGRPGAVSTVETGAASETVATLRGRKY